MQKSSLKLKQSLLSGVYKSHPFVESDSPSTLCSQMQITCPDEA
jgi:hypothetical protein